MRINSNGADLIVETDDDAVLLLPEWIYETAIGSRKRRNETTTSSRMNRKI
jgi:hypothetical protein